MLHHPRVGLIHPDGAGLDEMGISELDSLVTRGLYMGDTRTTDPEDITHSEDFLACVWGRSSMATGYMRSLCQGS
jgi:hypothetical protein